MCVLNEFQDKNKNGFNFNPVSSGREKSLDITVSRSALSSEANFARLETILLCVTCDFCHPPPFLALSVLKKYARWINKIKQAQIYPVACSETKQ